MSASFEWVSPEDRGFGLCSFGITEAIASFIAVDAGLGATAGAVGATALEGAAAGAGLSAVTGGNVGMGALTGAVTGGALGGLTGPLADATGLTTGESGALVGGAANAAGAAMTKGNPLTAGVEGAVGGYLYGSSPSGGGNPAPTLGTLSDGTVLGASNATGGNMLLDANGEPLTDQSGNVLYGQPTNTTSDGTTINPVSQQSATATSGAGGAAAGKPGGISNTSLALGALAAAGSLFNKPAVSTQATPGPSSVAQAPLFNSPLNTNVPGRTAVTPSILTAGSQPSGAQPNYWSYGGPEQTYFNGNSLSNYGFARGGALNHEFSVARNGPHVRGPGTGTSDSVPAQLSNGEDVLTYDDVARIGDGSNERGARILDRDRTALAKKVHQPQFPPKKLGGALNEMNRRAG